LPNRLQHKVEELLGIFNHGYLYGRTKQNEILIKNIRREIFEREDVIKLR